MRSFFVFAATLAASACALAQTAAPPKMEPGQFFLNTERIAAIEQLFVLTNTEQTQRQAISQLQSGFLGQYEEQVLNPLLESIPAPKPSADEVRDFEKKVGDLIAGHVDFQKSKAEFVMLYAQTFTADEIDGLVAFYKTPVGQALLKKQPELVNKGMLLAEKQLREAIPDIQKLTSQWTRSMKSKEK